MKRFFIAAQVSLVLIGCLFLSPTLVEAKYDPLSVPNNKYGIHIIEPTEAQLAATLVNSSGGDWGYVVLVIRKDDRNVEKWQPVFKDFTKKHLIPIVRIASSTKDDYWQIPSENDAAEWGDFFQKLHWPTNNHYIIAYNEPNHAKEWGNVIDPQSYARELNRTIDILKEKDPNAFVLNAGFDAAAPTRDGKFMDQVQYMEEMAKAVPDIFKKIDGWTSHSYPQPDFTGDPRAQGRNTITTYRWEQQLLKEKFGVENKPIFITETGWVHQYGDTPKDHYLTEEEAARNFEIAYKEVWNDPNLVVVAPFTLSYSHTPFDHFSWLRKASAETTVLGVATTKDYFKQFEIVQQLPKTFGKPIRRTQGELLALTIPRQAEPNTILSGVVKFKNTGETTWFDTSEEGKLTIKGNTNDTQSRPLRVASAIEPTREFELPILLLTPEKPGTYNMAIEMSDSIDSLVTIHVEITVTEPEKDEQLGIFDHITNFLTVVFPPIG